MRPLQGSFFIEQMTELVEEAVLMEFRRISDRGGVLGPWRPCTSAARSRKESMHYEHLKHSGELPIIGVNTFLNPQAAEPGTPELIRSTEAEKQQQIVNLEPSRLAMRTRHPRPWTGSRKSPQRRQSLRRPPRCRQGLQLGRSARPSTKSAGSTDGICERPPSGGAGCGQPAKPGPGGSLCHGRWVVKQSLAGQPAKPGPARSYAMAVGGEAILGGAACKAGTRRGTYAPKVQMVPIFRSVFLPGCR